MPRDLAGRGLALGVAPNCGLGRLCAYKDMRRCPVKHFQDFPRNPKTLRHAALGHSNKTSFISALGSPQHSPLAPSPFAKSGAAREQGFAALTPIPTDWHWDSVSLVWNNRRHPGPAACPQPAICLAATTYPEKRLARSCCVDHGTKRLGDLCGSTYDYHEQPPSSPAQPLSLPNPCLSCGLSCASFSWSRGYRASLPGSIFQNDPAGPVLPPTRLVVPENTSPSTDHSDSAVTVGREPS